MLNSMSFKKGELTVSKIDMAKVQLDAAIAVYIQRRVIVAITLAGAAEEIYGAMLRQEKTTSTTCLTTSSVNLSTLSCVIM